MKKYILIFLIATLLPAYSWTQTMRPEKIQAKIIEGLVYVLDQKKTSPDDILIIRTTASRKFYVVMSYNDTFAEAKEVTPPDLTAIHDNTVQIDKDSIYDILWVKKKKYQSIVLTDKEIPFKKLSSRFPDYKVDALQAEIKLLKDQAYYEGMKQKYSNLRIVRAQSFNDAFSQGFKNPDAVSARINYPEQAREHETQGQVKLGFVITISGDVEDIYVFQHLGDGCTASVITTIKEMSRELKERKYVGDENILFLCSIDFILIK